MIKRIVKSALRNAAATLGPHRWRRGPSLVVLMYHRILPADDPRVLDEQPGMIVRPQTLDMHLTQAKRFFDIVDLGSWLEQSSRGDRLPERALAITFDDGWRDNLEYAAPILERHEAPATIFLVSDMVGHTGNYWPEQLAMAVRVANGGDRSIWQEPAFSWLAELHPPVTEAHDPETADAAIVAAKTQSDDATLRERSGAMLKALGHPESDQPRSLLNWDEVQQMHETKLFHFGSHTLDHTRLNDSLDAAEIERQLRDSKTALESGLQSPISLFCYPNGDHTPTATELAAKYYHAAVTTRSGWNTAQTPRHVLHRVGLHEGNSHSASALLARLSGWL